MSSVQVVWLLNSQVHLPPGLYGSRNGTQHKHKILLCSRQLHTTIEDRGMTGKKTLLGTQNKSSTPIEGLTTTLSQEIQQTKPNQTNKPPQDCVSFFFKKKFFPQFSVLVPLCLLCVCVCVERERKRKPFGVLCSLFHCHFCNHPHTTTTKTNICKQQQQQKEMPNK